jgi:hypothetical protein
MERWFHSRTSAVLRRFASLFDRNGEMRFPCDADGHVEFDDFSDRCCGNYHHAWAAVGSEFSAPVITKTFALV